MKAFTNDSEIGGPFDFIGDAVHAIGDVVDDVTKGIGDVVKAIPGGKWLLDGIGTVTGAVGDFVKGPMRDFAKTSIGETIFRAASVAMQSSLLVVPGVGYTLGFLAWSVPGLAKGEKFDEAMTKEFIYRCQQVGEYFAGKAGEEAGKEASKLLGEQLKDGVEKLNQLAKDAGLSINQIVSRLGLTPESLANMLGIRQDVAAYAIGWAGQKGEEYLKSISVLYDPETGNPRPIHSLGKIPSSPPANKALGMAEAQGIAIPLSKSSKVLAMAKPGQVVSLGKKAAPPPMASIAKALVSSNVSTLAAKNAVSQAVNSPAPDASNQQIVSAAQTVADTHSTKLGIGVGLGSAVLGTGVSMLAGLSATVAAPIGIGFGIGSGIVTKLLTHKK